MTIPGVRILVTGGTGFIGRRLMAFLRHQVEASSIVCLARSSTNPRESEAEATFARTHVQFIRADLTDPRVSGVSPPEVDLVFHLAANIDTEGSEAEHRVNDEGTANLIAWLGERLRGCRLIYTSSVAVTDRGGPADGPLDESTPCFPRTAYGISKLRGEQVVRSRASAAGYTWTIVRLPTVYGPGQKADGMFDLLRSHGARGTLIGRLDWPGKSSIIHVDDVARLLWDVAVRPDTANETYCVASDESLTVGEIGRSIARATGSAVKPLRPPAWVWAALRRLARSRALAAMVPRSSRVAYWRLSLIVDHGFWFNTSKLRRVYQEPFRTLEEGLADTFEAGGPDHPPVT